MIDAGLRVYGEFCPDTSGYFGDDKMVVEIFRAMNVARSSAVTQALDASRSMWTARAPPQAPTPRLTSETIDLLRCLL